MNKISNISERNICSEYKKLENLIYLRAQFHINGYVKLPKLFNKNIFTAIQNEINRISDLCIRKDFVMKNFETERKMSVIGGKKIIDESVYLGEIYASTELREIASMITNRNIFSSSHENEFLVANFLDGKNDTHGWHIDDPRYALVLILESPTLGNGGVLEFIPRWKELADEGNFDPINELSKGIKYAEQFNLIEFDILKEGDVYLLDAANSLHRVTPIKEGQKRKILNMAFDDRKYRVYSETATELYA